MKHLLITSVFPPQPGGSGRWFYELYRRLPREQFMIVAGEHPQQEAFDATHDLRLERMPLKFRSWGVAGLARATEYWRVMRRIGKLVKQERIEVLHAGCILPEGFVAYCLRRLRGIPYAVFVHGEEMRIAAGSRELKWMAGRVLSGAEFLVANSNNTSSILRNEWHVPESRIRVLHPGVDTKRFTPASRNMKVREQLGWHDRPVVLTVGRLQKRKGQDMLIRALPAIIQRVPNVLYAIVGDGPERQALEALVSELKLERHVQFRGEPVDEELVACYQQCDLFVLPNREVNGDIEGFGMVLIEAQACGKPVIAGASGGTAETLEEGKTGFVLDCEKPERLAKEISHILSDAERRVQMGALARPWAEQFDWTAHVARAREMFQVQSEAHGTLANNKADRFLVPATSERR